MASSKKAALLATLALSGGVLLAYQLSESTRRLGEAFAGAQSSLDAARRHTAQTADAESGEYEPSIAASNESMADSRRQRAPGAHASDSLELRSTSNNETDLRPALEQALGDPDPDVRSEAAAVLGLRLAEGSASSQPD